jgi:hypothetical protein
MHIKKYIEKIVDDGDKKEMEELSEMLEKAVCEIKEYDEELYEKYKMKLYRMAYGDVLTKEMAENIIMNMQPYHMHWSLEETKSVQEQYGLESIRDIDFWIVMNSAYNDYKDLFDDNIEMYAKYSKNFIKDEDAKEGKVFLYFTKIPK